jgi:hypothetical protein
MTLFRLLVAALLLQTGLSQGVRPGSIRGVVVDNVTGAPISGLRVEVMGVQAGRVLARSVSTDSKGEFRFDNLPPGSGYQLVVTGEKLRPIAHGQRSWDEPWIPLTLESGQQLSNVRIGVRLPASILGRVVDSGGKGLSGARVTAMAPVYKEGRRVLETAQSAVTNSSGNYEVFDISSGLYYIRVLPPNPDQTRILLSEPIELDRPAGRGMSFKGEPEGYPLTYFPSSTSVDSARAVTVLGGEAVKNINITVARVRTSRVQGMITHIATGSPLTSGQVVLQRPGSSVQSNWTRVSEVRGGRFDIRAVLPGSYIVWVRATENGVRLWSRMPVEVVEGKTLQIDLKASPAPEVSGRITLEGRAEPTEADFTRLSVHLVPDLLAPIDGTLSRLELEVPVLAATPTIAGQFTLRDVPPWNYRVVVAPGARISANAPAALNRVYVKSIRNGEADIGNDGFQMSDTFTGSLEIVLASDVGGLDGRVLNESRQDAALAKVALVPDARRRIDHYFSTIASSTGRFRFQGVPPGSYKVFAWQNAPVGAWLDPDFLRAYENRAAPIRIEPDAAEYVELQWMR